MSDEIAKYLDWDSTFFGVRIGRALTCRLDARTKEDLIKWCVQERLDCIYFLADSSDQQTCECVRDLKWLLTDIRLTLALLIDNEQAVCPMANRATGFSVRHSNPTDLASLETIAKQAYTQSRFYYDKGFDRSKCSDLYRIWLSRSILGELADVVLVADDPSGRLIGFVTLRRSGDDSAEIGLLGVDDSARGLGVGSLLIAQAVTWCRSARVRSLQVVTQGRNVAAQRVYQRSGFLTHSVFLWYHGWAPFDAYCREERNEHDGYQPSMDRVG